MKNSTKFFALAGALSLGLGAQAQATFELSSYVGYDTHRTGAYVGDFSGNGKHDIFYRGQYSRSYEKPGIWSWTSQANMVYNLGDDQWEIDGLVATPNDEPNKDEDGNPILDENGNPQYNYYLSGNKHGIRCGTYDQSYGIDYNSDGLLDILVFGEDNSDDWYSDGNLKINHLSLYRNNGDGTFTLVEEAQFPISKPQKSFKSRSIAVGDYDHDGYPDFFVAGYYTDGGNNICHMNDDETLPKDFVALYHNDGGTGAFTRMDIAETKTPVMSYAITDENGGVAVEGKQLEGWFHPITGNCYFADLNNDGWLDIVNTGVFGAPQEDMNSRTNKGAVYINQNGEKFVEVTPEIFDTLRNGSGGMNDFDGDGMLDFFHFGWGDNGYGWEAFLYSNTGEESVFDTFEDAASLGVWGDEDKRCHIRDFDNDGNLDILYSNKDNKISICYGDNLGGFTGMQHEEYRSSNVAAVGDFNNDGLTDIMYCGDWGDDWFGGQVYYNTSDAVTAPEAPANVSAEYADGKLTITWDAVSGAEADRLAYNVFVKDGAGKLYTIVPADPTTGFVKVSEERVTALRPDVTEYTLTLPEGGYTVGVQTIALANESYSPFTTAITSGVGSVAAEKATFAVTVDQEGVYVAGNGEAVKVFNALGQTVAAGVAGEKIAVAASGVLVVVKGNETAKVIK